LCIVSARLNNFRHFMRAILIVLALLDTGARVD
jgi:hypothetical protein